MAGENAVKELVKKLSKFGVLVAADVDDGDLADIEIGAIVSRVLERMASDSNFSIINKIDIANMAEEIRLEKSPKPIEIVQKSDFKAYASEVDAHYSITNKTTEYTNGTVDGFVSYFRSRLDRLRKIIVQHRNSPNGMVASLEGIKSYSNGREITALGMISNKITTKNGNIMVVIEDETGEAKIIFMNGTSKQSLELFEKARHLVDDEVIAVSGKISGPFIIASEFVWPDIPINERKQSEEDVAIAFISDVHVGSKYFMERNFSNFIKWLNGNYEKREDLAGKVKYLVVGGDVVDGIGVYPNQDRTLTVLDIYTQYKIFFNFISMIPEYIQVFVIPGNHDAVQSAEPQPQLSSELVGDFKADNVHILPNPSFLTLHGIEILAYHGTSLDSIISAIPGTSYAKPEKAMTEILKRRHLSPIYGGRSMIVPSKHDNMVIDKVPDILHMGHVHKNGMANYHGVDIINSGTWQSTTDYQLSLGHVPTPCIVPIYEAKGNRFTTINFERPE
ncbi:MAG: DNA-directed DNA polymerase II small subunit [Candidatus Micrarchaeaceae archaeon]|jgi:DNA polymerase II small subunit|nr:DNA-directed DNA polymerase II small subunit [Candidatus Micrarchaeota archaeon]HII09723.1 DNA-directed DNA polymerase II small subunit [Candidatus Micrarchaeota archaeon]